MKTLTLALLILAGPAVADETQPDTRLDVPADIGTLAEAAAVVALLGLFGDETADPLDRMEAAWALGETGDPRAVTPRLAALEQDYTARTGMMMAIIPALGQIGDSRAVPLLLEALQNRTDDWLARAAAAEALGRIGDPAAVPTLVAAARAADTRDAAIGALARIGDPRAVEVLASALTDEMDPATSEMAAAGLVALGAPAVAFATDRLEPGTFDRAGPDELALIAVLGRIGRAKARDLLGRLVHHPDPALASAARRALE